MRKTIHRSQCHFCNKWDEAGEANIIKIEGIGTVLCKDCSPQKPEPQPHTKTRYKKVHYLEDNSSRCGDPSFSNKVTNNIKEVTCARCYRCLVTDGIAPRKVVKRTKEEVQANPKKYNRSYHLYGKSKAHTTLTL